MAQDQWTLQEKKQSKTGARAAAAGPCCSCQQDSSCSLQTVDPGAHGMNRGQSNTERGQMIRRAVGMAKVAGKHKACRTRLLQANKAIGRSARHRPHRNNSQQLAGLSPCSPGRWRECDGACTQEAGSDLPNHLPHTYRLCLSLSIPTPLILKNPI